MTAATNHKNGRSLFSLFRRGQQIEVTEVTGYQVGDLQEDKPVVIAAGSTLLGNVYAPEITVTGLLCGSAVTRQLTVQTGGQVWGDVFVVTVQVENGGRIQGWVSSLDEAAYLACRENGGLPIAAPQPDQFNLSDDLQERSLPIRNAAQLTALQQLQTQIAIFLAARSELERAFEQRVLEVAGEATTQVQSLLARLQGTQQSLDDLRRETAETQKQLQARETLVEQQTNELKVAHDLLEKQKEQIGQLQQLSEEQHQQIQQLETKKTDLENKLRETNQQLDNTIERVRTLEVALQTSLQHSVEQEQSLVRWQELAEATEKRSLKLESDLKAAQAERQQSNDMVAMLRDQRIAVEKEWEKTQAELDALRHQDTRPSQETVDRLSQLEGDLSELTRTAQEYQDQLIWYRASLESSQSELNQARQQTATQESRVEQLQNDVTTKQALAEKWQSEAQKLRAKAMEQEQILKKIRANAEEMRQQASNEISALRESLRQNRQLLETTQQEKGQEQKKLQTQLEQLRQQYATERSSMQETIRLTRVKMEEAESEMNDLRQQVTTQGKRVADIHASLIEKELQFNQAKAKVLQQQELMKKIRETADETIKRLNGQLQQAKEIIQARGK